MQSSAAAASFSVLKLVEKGLEIIEAQGFAVLRHLQFVVEARYSRLQRKNDLLHSEAKYPQAAAGQCCLDLGVLTP